MTSTHQPDSRDIAIAIGRAYLQMVAAAHVPLKQEPFWTEMLLLKLVTALYTHHLKDYIELLPKDMVEEILVVQDDIDPSTRVSPFNSN